MAQKRPKKKSCHEWIGYARNPGHTFHVDRVDRKDQRGDETNRFVVRELTRERVNEEHYDHVQQEGCGVPPHRTQPEKLMVQEEPHQKQRAIVTAGSSQHLPRPYMTGKESRDVF